MLTFTIESDLYQAGFNDDGHPYIAEVFYVMVENDRGDRWKHHQRFPGCRVESFEGEPHFADIRVEATADAERIRAMYADSGITEQRIEQGIWFERSRPAYGSDAYQDYGQSDDWAEEQLERLTGRTASGERA